MQDYYGGGKNECSVLHLKNRSEVTKLNSKVSLSQENFHFPRSGLSRQGLIVVQLRPQASAGQSDQGCTVQIKEIVNPLATEPPPAAHARPLGLKRHSRGKMHSGREGVIKEEHSGITHRLLDFQNFLDFLNNL